MKGATVAFVPSGEERERTVAQTFRGALQRRQFPLVVNVRRYSLEDGPGIRSVVFFKGCPLRCTFCQNPEAQSPDVEIAYSPLKCIGCGHCAEACPCGAVTVDAPGCILRDQCRRCGACTEACPTGALRRIGTPYPPEALAEMLLRDFSYYKHSGGGVTLSGGEATLYTNYVERLLQLLKSEGVHLLLETCGHFRYETFRHQLLPYLDTVYFDIKFADAQLHRRHTGKPNERILDNLRRLLAEPSVDVLPRVPLIPGITATQENLSGIVDLLCDAGASCVHLLPYNPMGLDMFEALGRSRPSVSDSFMKPEDLEHLHKEFRQILEQRQLSVRTPELLLGEQMEDRTVKAWHEADIDETISC